MSRTLKQEDLLATARKGQEIMAEATFASEKPA